MLPEFRKGQPITAKDLNSIVQEVVRLMNITGNSGISVTKNSNGFSLRGTLPGVETMKGKLIHQLPYNKAGVCRVYDTTGMDSDASWPKAESSSTVRDAPSETATSRYEWVINWCLESGKNLPNDSEVICVRIKGWWVIVCSKCPEE